jgi:Zn ribbon nucleic-acid-binding protein
MANKTIKIAKNIFTVSLLFTIPTVATIMSLSIDKPASGSINVPPNKPSDSITKFRNKFIAGSDQPYGVDTCKQGYVWREAQVNDRVCVTSAVRTQTRNENDLAASRREPTGGAYGPNTCKQGFVWREATASDPVCVTPEVRAQAADDNQQATERRVLATSATKIQIMDTNYGGNGCPANSASMNVSPDGQRLTILFDKFVVQGNDPNNSRKSCNLVIPIKVPQGYQISLYNADYHGYVASQTKGTFRSEYFFAGNRGPVFQQTFNGESKYAVTDSLATVANVWSGCGNSENMRVNASISARGQGMATVDSFNLASRGLVYHIRYRTCR